jgi:uncharacterized protein with PQ loop repeat
MNEILGWAGVVLIQGATLPPSIKALRGDFSALPPLSFVLMIWAGLFFYLIRAIRQRDRVYIISNAVGFLLNTVMLACIVYPKG